MKKGAKPDFHHSMSAEGAKLLYEVNNYCNFLFCVNNVLHLNEKWK